MIGRHGLNSHQKALETTASLELKLANLQEESAKLKKRVKLLMDGSIEYDMLDEQARYHLNLIQDDEIVIMRVIK